MTHVHIDGSQRGNGSQLALCASCPGWRELRGTREAALTAAAEHLARVHGTDDTPDE